MATRLGNVVLQQVAKRMCSLLVKFSPIIAVAYPDNTVLQLALATALEACSALDTELEEIRIYGS